MRNHYVLIDFENVQPASLELLASQEFRVLVFVGENQTKLPFGTVVSLQKLGVRAEYVKIAGNGSNALDFHIAYYVGVLSAAEPAAHFYIVSKDAGFDPLIRHLKSKNILTYRVKSIGEIMLAKANSTKSPEERILIVVERLARPEITKPRTVKTLSSSIASYFQKQLTDEEVSAVVAGLILRGAISVVGTRVTYAS